MVNRYIAVGILAGLLAACGAKIGNESPQSDQDLLNLVTIPSGWGVDGLGELDRADIPADAYTGLQESFRAVISKPNQPEGSTASAYFLVLLYEDTVTARDAYMQIRTYMLAEGAEIGETEGSLPNEEITFALTSHDTTSGRAASSFAQTTILTCRAVLRYNWAVDSNASFTLDEAINVELTSAREIRRVTCDEE